MGINDAWNAIYGNDDLAEINFGSIIEDLLENESNKLIYFDNYDNIMIGRINANSSPTTYSDIDLNNIKGDMSTWMIDSHFITGSNRNTLFDFELEGNYIICQTNLFNNHDSSQSWLWNVDWNINPEFGTGILGVSTNGNIGNLALNNYNDFGFIFKPDSLAFNQNITIMGGNMDNPLFIITIKLDQ